MTSVSRAYRHFWKTLYQVPAGLARNCRFFSANIPALGRRFHRPSADACGHRRAQPETGDCLFRRNAGPGVARPAYLAEVLAPARSWPLPAEGVEALERI